MTRNPAARSESQSALFHRICTALEKSDMEWGGKRRSKACWKGLLVSGHAVATGVPVEVVEGLEGELINLRESTRTMLKSRSSSLIDYAMAFCAAHGIPV